MLSDSITELKGQELMSFKLIKKRNKETNKQKHKKNTAKKKVPQPPLPAWLSSKMRTERENIKLPPAKEACKIRLSLSGDCSAGCWRYLNRIVSQLGAIHREEDCYFLLLLPTPSFPSATPVAVVYFQISTFICHRFKWHTLTSEFKPHRYSHFQLPSLYFRADLWYLPASLPECSKQFIPQCPACKEIMPELLTGWFFYGGTPCPATFQSFTISNSSKANCDTGFWL